MRSPKGFAILIVLLCAGQLHSQQTARSAKNIGSSKAAEVPATSSQNDWREAVIRNSKAPIKIVEFFDYQCPYCNATIPALQTVLKNHRGQIELVLKQDPLAIHPDSMLAHQAALAAAEQGKFWEMNDLLFAHQRKVKFPDLLAYARQLQLNVPRFEERLKTGYYEAAVEKDMTLAKALGVSGTPTFFINGQKLSGAQTVNQLENAIQGNSPLGKDAAKIRISSLDFSHSPVRGAVDAPITIVEFADFQCPFCARTVSTMEELLKQYPTQIKWVFKNHPLSFHADSLLAHRAVLAAGEQNKFWEMHDLVFSDQKSLKMGDLLEKARSLNLDMTRFMADLDSDRLKERIDADEKEGNALHVNGTPTFYINGREFAGALTIDKFRTVIDSELAHGQGVRTVVTAQPREDVVFGPANAPITLIWFSDLESKLSLPATLLVKQLMNMHPGKIRLAFKNRPLESHPNSMMLHEAAMAANAQGKFWPMHDLIVANPEKRSKENLLAYARRIGLDLKLFQSDLYGHKYRSMIESDLDEAQRKAVKGSPVFFVNGTRIDGLQPETNFDDLIAAQLSTSNQANLH